CSLLSRIDRSLHLPDKLVRPVQAQCFGATTQQVHSAIVGEALPRRMTAIATPYQAALTVEKEQ
ncbi:MAG: hypothetical protein WA869_36845, partial [Alloacidobacterium sp.]